MSEVQIASPFRDKLQEVTESVRNINEGSNADYIPALQEVNPDLLATAVMTPDGDLYAFGDTDHRFTIQSMSKPLVYGLAIEKLGIDKVLEYVGVEPSGDAFNSISLDKNGRPVNPMINAGAITIHGLLQQYAGGDAVNLILDTMSQMAGRDLRLNRDVARGEAKTGYRNRAIANLLRAMDNISGEPLDVVEGYFEQCSIELTICDLAAIGATLASGGVQPVTRERVFSEETVQWVLSVMSTSGMYDAAGNWMNWVGIPAKSGVSGGIIGVIPGQLSIASFSPRLDEYGNSVRSTRFFKRLSQECDLHMMRATARPHGALRQQAVVDFDDDGIKDTTLLRLYGDIDFPSYQVIDHEVAKGAASGTHLFLSLVEVRCFSPLAAQLMEELLDSAARHTRVYVHDPADLLDHGACSAPKWVDRASIRDYLSESPERLKPLRRLTKLGRKASNGKATKAGNGKSAKNDTPKALKATRFTKKRS